jgi:hypothetical protein
MAWLYCVGVPAPEELLMHHAGFALFSVLEAVVLRWCGCVVWVIATPNYFLQQVGCCIRLAVQSVLWRGKKIFVGVIQGKKARSHAFII